MVAGWWEGYFNFWWVIYKRLKHLDKNLYLKLFRCLILMEWCTVTTAVRWQVVIWIEDTKHLQSYFIPKFSILRNSLKCLVKRNLSYCIVIFTVIREGRIFLCMEIIIQILQSNVEYFLLLWASSWPTLAINPHVLLFRRVSKAQPE